MNILKAIIHGFWSFLDKMRKPGFMMFEQVRLKLALEELNYHIWFVRKTGLVFWVN